MRARRLLATALLLASLVACGGNKDECAKLRSQRDAIDDTIDTTNGVVVESMLAVADDLTEKMQELGCES